MPEVDPSQLTLLGTHNSGTFQGYIPPEMSQPYFQEALKHSAAMPLIPQVPLGPQGKLIPMFTGTPTAEWVSEAGKKPISTGDVSLQTMRSEKLAGIFVVSAEVVRANPGGFIENMRGKLGESFATAFDNAFFHGGGSGSSTSPFSQNLDQTSKVVELETASASQGGIYADMVSGLSLLVEDRKRLRAFALDEQIEPHLLRSLDANGRPFFVESPYTGEAPVTRTGTLLGRRATLSDGIRGDSDTLGYGGDFAQAIWGVVGGISYDVTDQATLPIGDDGAMVSLWQHNLLAVRAEAEFGFLINDVEAFVRYVAPEGDGLAGTVEPTV